MKPTLAVWITVCLMMGMMGTAGATTKHGRKPTWQAQHTMTGTVTNVDHTTGMLSLNMPEGELMLHFPPATLTHVQNGETLTVSLGFHEGAPMPAGSHASMSGMSEGQH